MTAETVTGEEKHARRPRRARERRRKPRAAWEARQHDLPDRDRQGHDLVSVHEGKITAIKPGPFITPNYSFALRASRDAWEKLWSPQPLPGFTDIFALVKKKLLRIEGYLHPFMSNLLYFKGVIAAVERVPDEPALRTSDRPLPASRSARPPASPLRRGSRPPAFRCSACTPPAPTAGSIAACLMTSASRRTIA